MPNKIVLSPKKTYVGLTTRIDPDPPTAAA